MAYKVLYRKYRPDSFEKIIGQKNLVDTLKNSIINSNFSHAYIFTGPRGTGKTSSAKVFAKAINCENPINGEPCNKCSSCINFTTSPDIIEIDAASNNGVDEIRELRNNISLSPSASKYKIYIVDEVHMLTTGAFNALLKTLEEPPLHVIFILATTEIYKVPITILSRCQRYDFKKIDGQTMINYLKIICDKENISIEEKALKEIYYLSEGCLRDALSILDQLSKNNTNITYDNVIENYSVISDETIDELLEFTNFGKVNEIINVIEKYQNNGMNAQKLIKKIIQNLENKAIKIKNREIRNYEFKFIDNLITGLNKCYVDARYNENVYTMIKLVFLENVTTEVVKADTVNVPRNEKNIVSEKDIIQTPTLEVSNMSIKDIRLNNCFVDANKNDLANFTAQWEQINIDLLNGIKSNEFKPVVTSGTHCILVNLHNDSSLVDLFNSKYDIIDDILLKNNINHKIVFLTDNEWNNEKNNYISNKSKGIKYEMIVEPVKVKDDSNYKKTADSLFSNDVIEIK